MIIIMMVMNNDDDDDNDDVYIHILSTSIGYKIRQINNLAETSSEPVSTAEKIRHSYQVNINTPSLVSLKLK